ESPDHATGSSLRRDDSLLYLIGNTEDEMGGSVFARTHGVNDCKVPQTDCAKNMELYKAYYNALTSGLVLSAHDVSEGGLAVTAAEMAFSGKGGVQLDLTKVPTVNGWKSPAIPLFSESTGRILVEVDPEFAADFEAAMEGFPCACIGRATPEKRLAATCCGGEKVLDCELARLKKLWKDGLTPYY
ncbi:MAG: AIR synthase-related protein, partial [Akkermansia sp.]